MKRSILWKLALSGVMAVGIGFGARGLVPSAAAAEGRPYCSDDFDCQNTCETLYPGEDVVGVCSSGNTCYCYR